MSEPELKDKLIGYLLTLGGRNLTDRISKAMRRLLSPKVAKQYTITGRGKDGPMRNFKDTNLMGLLWELTSEFSHQEILNR